MADYGVLLLGHLARSDEDLSSASDLSAALHMPRAVVSNLLKAFREHGLLESRRGLHGGYRLSRSPDDITLLEVLRAVDGPVQLTDCVVMDLANTCEYEDVCATRSPLRAVNKRIVDMLEALSLTEISESPLPAHPLSSPK